MNYLKLATGAVLMPAFWAGFIISGNYTPLASLYGDLLTSVKEELASN